MKNIGSGNRPRQVTERSPAFHAQIRASAGSRGHGHGGGSGQSGGGPPNTSPWATLDGSANAPAGTPQYPALLSGYAARPPWKAAGVDYHVGIDRSLYPTDAALKDPATITNPGFALVGSNWTITSPMTIDGYDFSLYIWGVNIATAGVTTFTNCKFGSASAHNPTATQNLMQLSAPGGDLTVSKCDIDGGSPNNLTTGAININGHGTVTVTYNWIKNQISGSLLVVPNGNCTIVYKYNLLDKNCNWPPQHLNDLEFVGANQTHQTTVEFNTVYQEPNVAGGELFQFYIQTNGTGTQLDPNCSYNTMIASLTSSIATARQNNHAYKIGDMVTVAASAAAYYAFAPPLWSSGATYAAGDGIIVWNMTTGADWYLCTVGGTVTGGATPPAGYAATGPGALFVDGTATFMGKNSTDTVNSAGADPGLAAVGVDGLIRDGSVTWKGRTQSVSAMLHGTQDATAAFNTAISGNAVCSSNYMDTRGCLQSSGNPIAFYSNTSGHSFFGWSVTGNIDMTNGNTINLDNTET